MREKFPDATTPTSRSWPATGSTGDFLAAYTRWDSRIARQFKWLCGKAKLAAIVQNFTNTRFREFYADNVWGRRAYATLRLEF